MSSAPLHSPSGGDTLDSLPVDKTNPSHEEMQIVNNFFHEKHSTMTRILSHLKDVMAVGLLFAIFSLPQFDTLLQKWIPSTGESLVMLVLVKTIFFAVAYFLLKNLYLGRRS